MTTEAIPAPSGLLDKIRNYAAVVAAVVGAITALWGVYEKVRSEARKDTAASYNTLAPQVNQMGEALKQLQQENQQLRQIMATQAGKPRLGVVPPRKPASPSPKPTNAAAPPPPAAATDAGAQATAPPPAPAAAPTPGAATPAAEPTNGSGDAVEDLLRTVGRTRTAIETLRKVPEDFGRVVEKKSEPQPPPPAPPQ